MRLYLAFFLLMVVGTQIILKTLDTSTETTIKNSTRCLEYTRFMFSTDGITKENITNYKLKWTRDMFRTDDDAEFSINTGTGQITYGSCYTLQFGSKADLLQISKSIEIPFSKNGRTVILVFKAIDAPGTPIKDTINQAVNLYVEKNYGIYGQLAYEVGGVQRYFVDADLNADLQTLTQSTCVIPETKTIAMKDIRWFNCTVEDMKVTDFYYNGFSGNWTMWLWIFLMMMYFLVGSFEADEMDLFYHKDEPWSHHPAYSIKNQITVIVSKY